MKSERNILIAFILNLIFSVFEIIGGVFTGSVAIISDALHDFGDAASIGISYLLEKKSKKQLDGKYTYGYARYSVLGSVISVLILAIGSVAVIVNVIRRFINPVEINYSGMIVFAVIGVCVNFCAALITRKGKSLNQTAVNLHMLEDVLGWAVVLIGALVMKFTDFMLIDPIISVCVAVFILINAVKNLKKALCVFLEKTPEDIDVDEIKKHIEEIEGVIDVHHIHIWSMNGESHYATMHIVTNSDSRKIKEKIREELNEHGICHVTLETEAENERCIETECCTEFKTHSFHGHHHH